ncbi:MAG: colanic acid biosynthesis glycosyltransferase WcaI [Candidatus Electrothrix sp. AW5]|nr:colanic acid biosynthesis glycosyltransferase WcaI [Candidatus Electrothrix gigas]
MKILVCGINYSPELVGIGKYTSEMVEWLAASGHECRVITAFPYYPMWFLFRGYSGLRYCKEEINRVTVYRCPLWIPKKLTTIKRIIHLLSFTISSCPVLCLQLFFWRPDLVICIAPSFLAAPSVVFFSKLAKVKSWLHFQDFEICAMFGTGMASNLKKIDNLAHTMQRVVTKRFDRVSSISHTMCVSADRRCVNREKVILFPNWVDTELITPNVDDIYFRKKWKISLTRKVILYSGNLGEKQGLENIINVASFLRQRHDILFVIVGDGACKKKLQQCATVKELINLRFYPLQPKRYLPSLLRMADIHLVIQKSGVSDKLLPSKLTAIFSAGGHAIVTAHKYTELGKIIMKNNKIATLIEPDNIVLLSSAIVKLVEELGMNKSPVNKYARRYAIENFSKQAILKRFEQDISFALKK